MSKPILYNRSRRSLAAAFLAAASSLGAQTTYNIATGLTGNANPWDTAATTRRHR